MTTSDDRPDDAPADTASGPGIGDDQLPDDLQPGEDNPLAEPLDEEERRDDLDLGVGDPTERLGDGPQDSGPDGE